MDQNAIVYAVIVGLICGIPIGWALRSGAGNNSSRLMRAFEEESAAKDRLISELRTAVSLRDTAIQQISNRR